MADFKVDGGDSGYVSFDDGNVSGYPTEDEWVSFATGTTLFDRSGNDREALLRYTYKTACERTKKQPEPAKKKQAPITINPENLPGGE